MEPLVALIICHLAFVLISKSMSKSAWSLPTAVVYTRLQLKLACYMQTIRTNCACIDYVYVSQHIDKTHTT